MADFDSFTNQEETLRALLQNLKRLIDSRESERFNLAISGGQTAKAMFNFLAQESENCIPWNVVNFFWVDERCVDSSDDESNFKYANELLFKPLNIASENIYRIRGEEIDFLEEAERYGLLAKKIAGAHSRIPQFDCVILGIGQDGHTASIFPQDLTPLVFHSAYAPMQNPNNGQWRISMTGTSILHAHEIFALALGKNKASILQKIISELKSDIVTLPSSYILRNAASAKVFTDALA